MIYIVSVLFLLFFWCPCMAINVSVQSISRAEARPPEFISDRLLKVTLEPEL